MSFSELSDALEAIGKSLTGYDPGKSKSISLDHSPPIKPEALSQVLKDGLRNKISLYPKLSEAVWVPDDLKEMVEGLAEHLGIYKNIKKHEAETPEELASLELYCDITEVSKNRFFMATAEGQMSQVSATYYMGRTGITEKDAGIIAKGVVPQYLPRSPLGVAETTVESGEVLPVFNTYIPPKWMSFNPKTKDELPKLFEKLVKHLIPLEIEREYLYSWIYHSLYDRALVYLVLCGVPGAGKNTLKTVISSLHGYSNKVDGKRSTLNERFNSQLIGSTLIWFDELEYNPKLENTMKELQNQTIAIEKKGVDATRSTHIYASTVITNNKPRDNFLSFDARKFAPLQLRETQLGESMNAKEIDELVRISDESSADFDVAFIAQIGRWIKKHGKSNKWKKLEYHGPMFYKLAHISMFQWQKLAIEWTMETDPTTLATVDQNPVKGFVWSSLRARIMKRQKDRSIKFPEATSVEYFFRIFKDASGKTSFKTEFIPDNVFNDFWVKPLNKVKIVSEVDLLSTPNRGKKNGREENYDL